MRNRRGGRIILRPIDPMLWLLSVLVTGLVVAFFLGRFLDHAPY